MNGQPIAIQMATLSTRRRVKGPAPRTRRPRLS